MTREEKKQQIAESGNAMWALSDIWVEVDKIYDDFESRTCGNCRYCKDIGKIKPYLLCKKEDVGSRETYLNVELTFGCNKWEIER